MTCARCCTAHWPIRASATSTALDLREIIVSGDLAVVRLAWTLTVTLPTGQVVKSVEPGMDVLRKGPDGQWKIIRYIAYEAPERPIDGG